MLRAFLALLFLAAVGFGQPLPDPFVVLDAASGNSASSPRICVRDSSLADVFWVRRTASDSEEYIEHAVVSLTARQLLHGPEVIQHSENWSQQIGDVISRGTDGWAAVLFEWGPYVANISQNRTQFAYGQNGLLDGVLLDTGHTRQYSGPIDCGTEHVNSNFTLADRVGRGWVLSWIRNGCHDFGGWTESENAIELGWISRDFEVETRAACCIPDYIYGPTDTRAISLDPDTVLLLSLDSEDNGSVGPGLSWQPFDPYQPSHVRLGCTMDFADLRQTRTGRLLAPASAGHGMFALTSLLEPNRDGGCSEIHSLPNLLPDAISYHPDYGFAFLSVVESSDILLARIDTSGQEVQPLGVFYERDTEHAIVQADVTIADDGRVVVLWTERAEGSPNASIVKAAWVNWTTFLGADDPRSIPRPLSLRLSCAPNPFNSELRIEYVLPRAQNIALSVYNLLGQKVADLFDGAKAAGTHSVTWSPQGGTGIYFVTLKAGGVTRTSKVVYLR